MKGLKSSALKSYEATPEEFETYRRRSIDEGAHLCGGEEVLSAAQFRQGGAAGEKVAGGIGSRLGGLGGGLLAKKGSELARNKRAGGLPKSMLLRPRRRSGPATRSAARSGSRGGCRR
jgi:hypothetical protein